MENEITRHLQENTRQRAVEARPRLQGIKNRVGGEQVGKVVETTSQLHWGMKNMLEKG